MSTPIRKYHLFVTKKSNVNKWDVEGDVLCERDMHCFALMIYRPCCHFGALGRMIYTLRVMIYNATH